MKFGKIEDIDNVEFLLPDDHSKQLRLLKDHAKGVTRLYTGASGWSVPDWKGNLYPTKSKSSEFLYFYSRQFNTIELNTTHYRLPEAKTIKKWKEQVPQDFIFCPKVWKNISHRKQLSLDAHLIEEFCTTISLFEENLGPCFLQLPPYFGDDRIELLEKFFKKWPKDIKLAVEVRHESFQLRKHQHSLFDLFERFNICCVITDVSGRRDLVHSRLTTYFAMIRWVGNGFHSTDFSRLDEWVDRIHLWSDLGLNDVFFFPHQPNNLMTPETAKYVVKGFANSAHFKGRGPSDDMY